MVGSAMVGSAWRLLAFCSAIAVLASSSLAAEDEPLAIVGGTLIDGNGGPPVPNGIVVVRGEQIVAVGAASDVDVPEGARVVEAAGMSVLPGLADMHVHLLGGWDGVTVDMLGYRRYLNALLYAGVTTVFDTGNVLPYVLQMRDAVASGAIAGPRILAVGALVDGPDPVWPPISIPVASTSQIPGVVELLASSGVDAIKAYKGLSIPMLVELVRASTERGLPVVADLWSRTGSYDVAASGVAALAHLPSRPVDAPTLELLQTRDIAVITTLAAKESFSLERLADLTFLDHPLIVDTSLPTFVTALRAHATRERTADEAAGVARWQASLRVGKENALVLQRAGVMLVAGTDAPYPGTMLGEGIHRELELLVEGGLTPLQALSAATCNAARLLKSEDWGALEVGKRADLVLVRGRPDRRIADTRNVEMVVQGGRIVDRDALRFDPARDGGLGAGVAVDR